MKLSLTSSPIYQKNTKTGCKVLFPHFVTGTTRTIFAPVSYKTNNIYNYKIVLPHSLTSSTFSFAPRISYMERTQRSSSSATAGAVRFSSTRTMPKGKGGTSSREVDISKSLSYLLRHGARKEGLRLDDGGWANVADVVGFVFLILFFGFFVLFLRFFCVCVCFLSEGLGLKDIFVCQHAFFLVVYGREENPSMVAWDFFFYVLFIFLHDEYLEHLHRCMDNAYTLLLSP